MSTSSSQLLADVARLHVDAGLMHDVIHGSPAQSVPTEGGAVRTVANAIASVTGVNVRGAWVTGTAYAVKDVYTDSGIAYLVVLAHTSTTISADVAAGKAAVYQGVLSNDLANEADLSKGAGLVGGFIASSRTLNVPAQYATIQAAFAYLADKTIARGATVTIKVADGTYVLTSKVDLNHPQGRQIRLIGNEVTPDNCVLMGPNPPTFDALACTDGHTFGYLSGFRVDLASKAPFANNWTGILADNGGRIRCGDGKIKVNNWYYGIAARNGSFIECLNAFVDNAGDVGIWAFVGSTISARGAVSNNAKDTANGWGWGFEAEYGSSLDCSGGSATGCQVGGIGSLSNSNVRALGATASGNIGSGFFARDGATIENHNGTANNNGRYGIEEIGASRVLGNGLILDANTLGPIKQIATLDNGSLGARVVPNAPGALRIDTADGSSVYFNTGGGLQAEVRHQASATSRTYQQGGNAANGDQPVFGVDGAATNIAARYQSKGTGSHYYRTGGGTQFEVKDTAGAVNRVFARGGGVGSPAVLGSDGDEAVIDLQLSPKGAGSYIRLGAGYVGGAPSATGYIEIKDNTGTVRKVLVG